MKKAISMILFMLMLLPLLFGCTPTEPTGTPPTDPTEVTVPTISTDPTQPTKPAPTEPTPTEPTELVTVHCIREVLVWQKNNDQTQHNIFTYDEYGNLLERKSKTNGSYKTEETYQYDADGNLVYGPLRVGGSFTPVTYTYDTQGRLLLKSWREYQERKEVYSYDDIGNLIYEEHWFGGELSLQITREYNAAGLIVYEEWDYVSEDEFDYFIYWVYDDRGNILTETTYYDDTYRGEKTYTYDENGWMKTEKRVWDGYVQYDYTYYYDEEGNLIRQGSYVKSAIALPGDHALYYVEKVYEYDALGNRITEKTTYEDGAVASTIRWTYDAQGNMLSRDDGTILDRWTYDQWGNVLSRSHYFMDELSWEITYSYTSFQVSSEGAEQIRQQQAEYYRGPGCLE